MWFNNTSGDAPCTKTPIYNNKDYYHELEKKEDLSLHANEEGFHLEQEDALASFGPSRLRPD